MKNLDKKLFEIFSGGWQICEISAYISFCFLEKDNINFLEIGGGQSTRNFVKILDDLKINYNYYCIEHNEKYMYDDLKHKVNYINYYIPPNFEDPSTHWDKSIFEYLLKVDFTNLPKLDFILVDGPNGIARSFWYSKIKNKTNKGCVILIDDFHHFKEFSDELDFNINYELITEFCNDSRFSKTYINKGLREILENENHYNKTFKIVKVK